MEVRARLNGGPYIRGQLVGKQSRPDERETGIFSNFPDYGVPESSVRDTSETPHSTSCRLAVGPFQKQMVLEQRHHRVWSGSSVMINFPMDLDAIVQDIDAEILLTGHKHLALTAG
jgi:hypothetical protein